jgi:hypothetical protein
VVPSKLQDFGKKKQEPVANNTQNEKPATTKAKRAKRQVRTKLIK